MIVDFISAKNNTSNSAKTSSKYKKKKTVNLEFYIK